MLRGAPRRSIDGAGFSNTEVFRMSAHKLLLLPGDGIGPEITAEAEKVLALLSAAGVAKFEIERFPFHQRIV